jgi:putative ABC transport system permease protein
VNLVHGSSWSEGTHRDRNPVVVVSHEIWQRLFGGDPSIAGQTLPLDFSSYEVLGVAPPGFDFPAGMDLFRAAYLGCAQNWDMRSLFVVARLRRGVSLERGRQRLALFGEQMERTYPRTNEGVRFRTRPLREAYVGEVRPHMLLTLALAGLVLLIACGNVVNLLLSRGLARKREIAMKTALGASRGRLVRQFLAESGVLAAAGGVAGFGLAYWWTGLMKQWFRVELPSWMAIELDGRMTLFALVISELALAVALLVFAGLLVKSFWLLQQTGPGFDGAPALTFRTDPPWARYNEVDQTAPFYRRAIEELSAIPGVTGAAANHSFPLALNQNYGKPSIVIEGQSADEQLRKPVRQPADCEPKLFRSDGYRLSRRPDF